MIKDTKKRLASEFDEEEIHDVVIHGNKFDTVEKYIHNPKIVFSLQIMHNNNITSIPDIFPNLYELRLIDSFVGRILCHQIRYLHIEKNYELRYINDIKNLRTIFADRCMNLYQINNHNVRTLDVSNCIKLEKVNNTNKLEQMILYHCPKLNTLEPIHTLKHIRLTNCHSIKGLSNYPNLTHIFINNCTEFTSLSNMSNVRYLEIIRCPKIKNVHTISHIEHMYVSDCSMFNQLVNIQSITTLVVVSSPLCRIHDIPIFHITLRNTMCPILDIRISELNEIDIQSCYNTTELYIESINLKKLHVKNSMRLKTVYIKNQLNVDKIEIILEGDMDFKKIVSNCKLKLDISDNHKLTDFKKSNMLEELYIKNCSKLSIIESFENLLKLSITNCEMLKSLSLIDHIQYLHIQNCNIIERIDSILNKLKVLSISNCTMLIHIFVSDMLTHITIKKGGIILINSSLESLVHIKMVDATYFGTLDSKKEFYEKYYSILRSVPIIQKNVRIYILKKYRNKPSIAIHADTCSICLSSFKKGEKEILSCFHVFHMKCIKMWFHESTTCPICKNPCIMDME